MRSKSLGTPDVDDAFAVKERDHHEFPSGPALSSLLGSVGVKVLPLGTHPKTNFVHKIRHPDIPLPPTPLLITHFLSALLELLVQPEYSCTAHKVSPYAVFIMSNVSEAFLPSLTQHLYRIATLQVVFTT